MMDKNMVLQISDRDNCQYLHALRDDELKLMRYRKFNALSWNVTVEWHLTLNPLNPSTVQPHWTYHFICMLARCWAICGQLFTTVIKKGKINVTEESTYLNFSLSSLNNNRSKPYKSILFSFFSLFDWKRRKLMEATQRFSPTTKHARWRMKQNCVQIYFRDNFVAR